MRNQPSKCKPCNWNSAAVLQQQQPQLQLQFSCRNSRPLPWEWNPWNSNYRRKLMANNPLQRCKFKSHPDSPQRKDDWSRWFILKLQLHNNKNLKQSSNCFRAAHETVQLDLATAAYQHRSSCNLLPVATFWWQLQSALDSSPPCQWERGFPWLWCLLEPVFVFNCCNCNFHCNCNYNCCFNCIQATVIGWEDYTAIQFIADLPYPGNSKINIFFLGNKNIFQFIS